MSPPRTFGMMNDQCLFLKQMYEHEDKAGLGKVVPGLPLPNGGGRHRALGASACSVPFGSLSVTAK